MVKQEFYNIARQYKLYKLSVNIPTNMSNAFIFMEALFKNISIKITSEIVSDAMYCKKVGIEYIKDNVVIMYMEKLVTVYGKVTVPNSEQHLWVSFWGIYNNIVNISDINNGSNYFVKEMLVFFLNLYYKENFTITSLKMHPATENYIQEKIKEQFI